MSSPVITPPWEKYQAQAQGQVPPWEKYAQKPSTTAPAVPAPATPAQAAAPAEAPWWQRHPTLNAMLGVHETSAGPVTRFIQGAGLPSALDQVPAFAHSLLSPDKSLQAPSSDQQIPLIGPMIRAQDELTAKAKQPGATLGTKIDSYVPILGPIAERMNESVHKGDYAGAFGNLASVLMARKAVERPEAPTNMATTLKGPETALAHNLEGQPTMPTLPQNEVPRAQLARNLTRAVNPPVNEWPNYMRSVGNEASPIAEFAQRNGIKLNRQLNFAQAAKGAGNEANQYYKQNVLGPVENKMVANVDGRGGQMTLGALNAKVVKLNSLLDSAYNKAEGGLTREALAAREEVVAERDALTSQLHKNLAEATGMTPEDVASLRQRIGQRYSIADQTTRAINQREASSGKGVEGRRDIPLTVSGSIASAFNTLRGGPEGIANRRLGRTLSTGELGVIDALRNRAAGVKGVLPYAAELPQVAPPEAPLPRRPFWQLQNKVNE